MAEQRLFLDDPPRHVMPVEHPKSNVTDSQNANVVNTGAQPAAIPVLKQHPGNGPVDAFIINGQSPPTNNTEIHNFTSQFDIDSSNHIDSLPFGLKDISTGWSNASPHMTMDEESPWALYPSNGNVSIRMSWILAQRGLMMSPRNLFNLFNLELENFQTRN